MNVKPQEKILIYSFIQFSIFPELVVVVSTQQLTIF